tara:strand:+ start:2459 stop:3307 length:849 start_codon:yes stop_codon:yes gene_type:complete
VEKSLKKKIIIGSANFGDKYGINNKRISILNLKKIFKYLKKYRFNTIDTANSYKNSEKIIGDLIKKNKSDWKIISKVKKNGNNLEKKFLDTEKKLKVRPNILLAHNYKDFLNEKFHKQLIHLKKKYNIKIGVSVYTSNEIKKVINFYKIDVVQLPISILDQRLLNGNILQKLKKKKIEIHARSIFFKGVVFKNLNKFKANKFLFESLKELDKFRKKKLSMSSKCLCWVLGLKEIDKVVIGIENFSQLKKNINQVNIKMINEMKKIKIDTSNIKNKYLDLRNW